VRGGETAYYRNVEISVRDRGLTVVDPAGVPHPLPADALAWVSASAGQPRLLVLDAAGVVLAELPSAGWDVEELATFGDAAGVPLVEEIFPDAVAGRAAYPLPKDALRVYEKDSKAVLVQFLPVLVPVALIIVLVLLLGR
jgi:hypothetical protein